MNRHILDSVSEASDWIPKWDRSLGPSKPRTLRERYATGVSALSALEYSLPQQVKFRSTCIFSKYRKQLRQLAPICDLGCQQEVCVDEEGQLYLWATCDANFDMQSTMAAFEQWIKDCNPQSKLFNPVKNAKSSLSTVRTSTERSRYLLPRSQEVSGTNWQAWQAAACRV